MSPVKSDKGEVTSVQIIKPKTGHVLTLVHALIEPSKQSRVFRQTPVFSILVENERRPVVVGIQPRRTQNAAIVIHVVRYRMVNSVLGLEGKRCELS